VWLHDLRQAVATGHLRGVPKVTTCVPVLVTGAIAGQASGMASFNSRLPRLFTGMNLAAYVTWVAVLVLLLDSAPRHFSKGRFEAIACLVAFLAVFVIKQLRSDAHRNGFVLWLLLAVEGALALLICVFWSPGMVSPILTIVFMADCAMVLGAVPLVSVIVVVNIGLWIIASELWGFGGAWRIITAYAGFQVFAALTAWYARRAEETARQLRETNAHLLATRSLLEESARDHERLRLARELHDVAGHKLTALKLNLTAQQRETGGARNLDNAAQLATELLEDIRGVVAQFRQHDGLDIRAALKQLLAPLPAPPHIHLEISDDARVANVAQAEALLRVVQEAVTNVVRHSGARNAWIGLNREREQVVLRVRDDGKAVLPLAEGFGLAGMRERLAQLSGRLDISRAAQGGVALEIQLPLNA
jgi:signal transduction histidine kinase